MAEYLIHNGYRETFKKFQQEVSQDYRAVRKENKRTLERKWTSVLKLSKKVVKLSGPFCATGSRYTISGDTSGEEIAKGQGFAGSEPCSRKVKRGGLVAGECGQTHFERASRCRDVRALPSYVHKCFNCTSAHLHVYQCSYVPVVGIRGLHHKDLGIREWSLRRDNEGPHRCCPGPCF